MMSNHHGKEFLGFMTTGPPISMPESLWMWIAAPKMKVDEFGRPWQAPYALRKLEALLIDHGYNASVIDPDYVDRYLLNAKVLMLSHHDYFALCPPSSEWWVITKKEPVNARSFKKFMNSLPIREAKKNGLKIIVGGPSAWQWLYNIDLWSSWMVDTVVDGEGERIVLDLIERVYNGEPLPRYVFVGPKDVPTLDEIHPIKYASVNGLVEIMRGCPRRCKFCSVTLRALRYIPLEKIEEEMMVNVRNGVKNGILHSEDVLLYGARGLNLNPEALIKLHELARKHLREIAWSHAALATIKNAEDDYRLISRIMEIVKSNEVQNYLGVEVGLETGSPRLVKKIMPAKSQPYSPERWPEVVEDAFSIMHENHIVPAATVILGLPDETPEDLMLTAELIDRLNPYRSLIVPMFFVPMGLLKNKDWFTEVKVKDEHIEVMRRCLWHSIRWAEDIINRFYLKNPSQAPLRFLIKVFLRYVKWKGKSVEKSLGLRPTEAPITPITK
ncbi:MAG: B12-binding domain-containing radical SAM protein [Aigarchaeota archaeon]|nr:B12-binding domain-containing radical SAM protein [Aigarchaeota archaeon]MDW7985778.1 radical SAM protein [Nitrososphaerota archaeon]